MGVRGFGESQARICDEDAEELLCSLQESAFSLVSSQRSHAVHADHFSHNKYPLLLTHRTTQIHLLLLCPTKCRSEEHTSELQSHSDLVCRLLLEKHNGAFHRPLGDIRIHRRRR